MKRIGIWMDKEKALIVILTDNSEKLRTVNSEVDFFNPKGGSGTRFKGGPQDVIQDSKYLEREKHQLRTYFAKLADSIEDADEIALFGPADIAQKFRKELKKSHKHLSAKIKTVKKVDSMTENQIKALVRNFFVEKA
ncbi:FIG00652167: hypothetical protein [hydrothermal vent metagenome]|uniref:Host attachment protein n=1 Tax=hydrothermal vent metagenome TaxID=652676 RepID=A0A3B0TPM5_9ZZZZ